LANTPSVERILRIKANIQSIVQVSSKSELVPKVNPTSFGKDIRAVGDPVMGIMNKTHRKPEIFSLDVLRPGYEDISE